MHKSPQAFTRIELLAVIASVAIIICVAVPAFGNSGSRSQAAQCLNNLRLMGRATQMWASDFQDQVPWRTVSSEGGTMPELASPKPGLAWYEFSFMSNQLATPRILACPADSRVRIANDFNEYKSTGFRHDSTSYVLNLHALTELPTMMLFGDHNLKFDAYGFSSCISRVLYSGVIVPVWGSSGWTNAVHGAYGHVVLVDGSVSATTSAELRATLLTDANQNDSSHLLNAR